MHAIEDRPAASGTAPICDHAVVWSGGRDTIVIALMALSTAVLFWVDTQLSRGHLDGYPYLVPMIGSAFVRLRNFAFFCLPVLIALSFLGAHSSDPASENLQAETVSAINLAIASVALIGMAGTIEQRRRLHRRLTEQVQALRQAEQDRQRLMAVIAHDLRSPLNPIIGFASLIGGRLDRLKSEKVVEYANAIESSARDLQSVLEQLLEWVRTNSNAEALRRESASLAAIAREAAALLRPLAEQKGIRLDLDPADVAVVCDPVAVGTVVRNVVGNAIKFSPKDSAIKISIGREEPCSYIRVADHGIGMPPAMITQIMSGDVVASRAGTAGEKGTGLGLRICRKLMERNGGSLTIESAAKSGTSVRLSFCG